MYNVPHTVMWASGKKHCCLHVLKADSTSQQCIQFLDKQLNTKCTLHCYLLSWQSYAFAVFFHATHLRSADYAVARCLPVCPSIWLSHTGILKTPSALALCYSAAEYCAPVWSRSAHTSQVDVQLNFTMHIISGTLCSTPLPWLPVLSNIEPPALRRKAATDKLIEKSSNMTVGQSSLIYL